MVAVQRAIPLSGVIERVVRGLVTVDDSPSLESLLTRAGNGSREDFSKLYDQVASMVYGLAVRVVRDPGRAEDVAQEALIEVWRKAPNFDATRGSARAWIATIAHRRAIDLVRSEQASRDRAQRVASREPTVTYDSVVAEVESNAERTDVRRALEKLTDLQREVIELAYYGGSTYRQVAEDLGAPLGTVKTRMRDGLRRLAEILGDGHG